MLSLCGLHSALPNGQLLGHPRAAGIATTYDEQAAIGKRYRRQDEIGTPWCITVGGETANDGTVALRDRDTLQQVRISVAEVTSEIQRRLRG